MEFLQLKYFKAVADTGKISSAAAELFISAPALSASISRLEKELGVKLFSRSNNRISLNVQGEIFLQYVNQIFTSLECARMDIEHSLSDENISVHIAVTSSDLWMSLINEYSIQFPDSTLSSTTLKLPQLATIDLSKQYSFLLADKSDVLKKENLDCVKLFEDSPCVMLPVNHRLSHHRKILLKELEEETLFLPMAEQSLNHRLRKVFADSDFSIRHANECSVNICQYMVSEGRGISFSTIHTLHTASNVRYIPLAGIKCDWQQNLYYHKGRTFSIAEEQFKSFVTKKYNQN